MAIGAMAALTAHGIDVPFEVAVAGFDDIPMANFVNPPLTTVRQDTRQAGEMLVDSLLRLIHNEPVTSRMLPMQLIVRRSSLSREVATRHGHPED
jgi:DNA-binding LacI/PurR family transcriptional regulator